MKTWVHILKKKNILTKTGVCQKCGRVRIVKVGKAGIWKCAVGRREQSILRRRDIEKPYRTYYRLSGQNKCEKCGIKNNDIRFFDVNHKDCNHKNNEKSNLELLCPNCHRLETIILWDSQSKYK